MDKTLISHRTTDRMAGRITGGSALPNSRQSWDFQGRAELAASVAQERLRTLERVEAARKARGRWTRLWAAWRAE